MNSPNKDVLMCVCGQARVRERSPRPGRPPEGFRGGDHVQGEAAERAEARRGRAKGKAHKIPREVVSAVCHSIVAVRLTRSTSHAKATLYRKQLVVW